MLPITESDGAITFDVQVVPRASREKLGPVLGDRLKVQLTAPPVDGAANDALVALLARTFSTRRDQIHIIRGLTGRKKTVRVVGVTPAARRSLDLLRGSTSQTVDPQAPPPGRSRSLPDGRSQPEDT